MIMTQLSAETGPVLKSMNPSPRFKNTGPCFWCIDGSKCLNDTVFSHHLIGNKQIQHITATLWTLLFCNFRKLVKQKVCCCSWSSTVCFLGRSSQLCLLQHWTYWRAHNSAWCSSKEVAATLLCEEQSPPIFLLIQIQANTFKFTWA